MSNPEAYCSKLSLDLESVKVQRDVISLDLNSIDSARNHKITCKAIAARFKNRDWEARNIARVNPTRFGSILVDQDHAVPLVPSGRIG
jgi:hypothetical protein